MASNKKPRHGKRHHLAIKPLGIKSTEFEMTLHGSMIALDAGIIDDQHIANLGSLAMLCNEMGLEGHYQTHCDSLLTQLKQIHSSRALSRFDAISIKASAVVLLDWLKSADNIKMARAAMKFVSQYTEKIALTG